MNKEKPSALDTAREIFTLVTNTAKTGFSAIFPDSDTVQKMIQEDLRELHKIAYICAKDTDIGSLTQSFDDTLKSIPKRHPFSAHGFTVYDLKVFDENLSDGERDKLDKSREKRRQPAAPEDALVAE